MNKQPDKKQAETSSTNEPGYPIYPPEEDIFVHDKKDASLDADGAPVVDDAIDNGLDIPGADLDDKQEAIGAEDEENNYYSLGGDDHNDLDEDRG